ncbi:MAG: SpoIIE family protein phosphatase [Spirochaetales bacterium]|nr:SpoIIE family protein phosphatase [Spirochaetales bacterium]
MQKARRSILALFLLGISCFGAEDTRTIKLAQLPARLTYTAAGQTAIEEDVPSLLDFVRERKKKAARLQATLQLPDQTLNELLHAGALTLFTGYISDVTTIRINGQKIIQLGRIDPYESASYRNAIVDLPAHIFRKQDNVLELDMYGTGVRDLSIENTFSIGPARSIYFSYWKGELLTFLLLVAYALVGLYHLLLFSRRPRDRHNFFFGIFCLGVSFYWFFRTYSRDMIEPILLRQKLEYITLFLLGPLLLCFFSLFFNNRYGRFPLLYSIFALVLSVFALLGNFSVMEKTLLIWQISALSIIGYLVYLVSVQLFRKKNIDARYLVLGILLFVAGVIHDILAARGILDTETHVTRYAFTVFILGIGGVLANRFMRVHNEVEHLNANLEALVEKRTAELKKTLREVQALKTQQDGDYYLTSLLIQPLVGNFTGPGRISVEMFIKQKKEFYFRKWQAEIGGDVATAYPLVLRGKEYIALLNGDAMGKSIQGAGGALVVGTVFKSIVSRTEHSSQARNKSPERWLKDTFTELQNIFISFDGHMLLSAVICLAEQKTGLLYYINAEHPFSVLYRNKRADFIETKTVCRKIGIDILEGHLAVKTFRMQPDDILFLGSDGRDDLLLGIDPSGHRIINEDESRFLALVEHCEGDLTRIADGLLQTGALTDDLSLVRIAYLEDAAYEERAPDTDFKARIQELQQNKEYASALALCQQALEMYPEDANLLYRAMILHRLNGNTQEAIDCGERLRLRDPSHSNNLYNLCDAYRVTGDIERARGLFSQATLLDPDNAAALRLRQLLKLTADENLLDRRI